LSIVIAIFDAAISITSGMTIYHTQVRFQAKNDVKESLLWGKFGTFHKFEYYDLNEDRNAMHDINKNYILGIDFGTSSPKSAIVSTWRELIDYVFVESVFSCNYAPSRPACSCSSIQI
jgi:hypothetical protein